MLFTFIEESVSLRIRAIAFGDSVEPPKAVRTHDLNTRKHILFQV
jgi:hypothetical protein